MRRWIIWGLAVAFYFYEYFIRVAPSVMVEEIFKAFNIGAGVFGVISAAYLYAYAPMQLPVGVLMDRFGARKLLTFATLTCGIASILFGIAPGVWLSIIARLLMGMGSAFAFIGMVYISSHWFHGKILALLVGIGNSIGMLGAVFGEGPLSELVHVISWRPTSVILGIIGAVLGVVIYLAVRNEPPSMEHHDPKPKISLAKGIKMVCKNSQTWINGLVAMMFYTATVSFGGLWAIPFLQEAHGFSNQEASYAASMIYIGWIVAGPIIGRISDKRCNRKIMLFIFTLLSIFFFSLITYTPIHTPFWIFALMFLLGCSLSAQLLCYSLAIELNTPETKGSALALTNFLVFVAGSLIQTLIGVLLDLNWKGGMLHGVRSYSLGDFQIALLAYPITMLLAFFFTFFIKEKDKPWCKN
ncbi:MAG: MFS transporter [Chlamydiia bacterium]|nr:MFS transporter [Chlamydiia bacterium]